jgi:hypothetical protein
VEVEATVFFVPGSFPAQGSVCVADATGGDTDESNDEGETGSHAPDGPGVKEGNESTEG